MAKKKLDRGDLRQLFTSKRHTVLELVADGLRVHWCRTQGDHKFVWRIVDQSGQDIMIVANEAGVRINGRFFSPKLIQGRYAKELVDLKAALARAEDVHNQLTAATGKVIVGEQVLDLTGSK